MAEDVTIDRTDRNWWWRLSAGEQQNQYEQQEDRAEVAESILRKLLEGRVIALGTANWLGDYDGNDVPLVPSEAALIERLSAGGEGS